MVLRFNQIERGAQGQDGFTFTYPIAGGTAEEIVDALAPVLLRGGMSDDTRDIAVAFVMLLGVPDADRVIQAATVLLSSPEFLTH